MGGSADDQALLFGKFTSFTGEGLRITFGNLPEGIYEVTTYAWSDQVTGLAGFRVSVLDASEGSADCGGPWTGSHQQGITYTRHHVGTLTGMVQIDVTEPQEFGGACNGVQIRRTGTALAGQRAGSVNVDFAQLSGSPSASYPAQGLAGTWNTIVSAPSTTRLRSLDASLTEVKGFEDAQTTAKHQAARRWVSAVNNAKEHGEWAFHVCRDPQTLGRELDWLAGAPSPASGQCYASPCGR